MMGIGDIAWTALPFAVFGGAVYLTIKDQPPQEWPVYRVGEPMIQIGTFTRPGSRLPRLFDNGGSIVVKEPESERTYAFREGNVRWQRALLVNPEDERGVRLLPDWRPVPSGLEARIIYSSVSPHEVRSAIKWGFSGHMGFALRDWRVWRAKRRALRLHLRIQEDEIAAQTAETSVVWRERRKAAKRKDSGDE